MNGVSRIPEQACESAKRNRIACRRQEDHAFSEIEPLQEAVHRKASARDAIEHDRVGLGLESRPQDTFQMDACLL